MLTTDNIDGCDPSLGGFMPEFFNSPSIYSVCRDRKYPNSKETHNSFLQRVQTPPITQCLKIIQKSSGYNDWLEEKCVQQ